jgi:hypothetical protein
VIRDLIPALFNFIRSDAQIAAVVTDGGIVGIFPFVVPQGWRKPSIVHQFISSMPDYHYQGPSGFAQPSIQIDCYAERDADAATLNLRVRDLLEGYRGPMIGDGSPPYVIQMQGVFWQSVRPQFWDAERKLYCYGDTYQFSYGER